MIRRILGAARLDPAVYREVAADPGATAQALIVVAIATASQAIGDSIDGGLAAGLRTVVSNPLHTLAIALVLYPSAYIARRDPALLPGLLRAVAFATAPLVLYGLAELVGALGAILNNLTSLWMIGTLAAAMRGVVGLPWPVAILVAFGSLVLVALANIGVRAFGLL